MHTGDSLSVHEHTTLRSTCHSFSLYICIYIYMSAYACRQIMYGVEEIQISIDWKVRRYEAAPVPCPLCCWR